MILLCEKLIGTLLGSLGPWKGCYLSADVCRRYHSANLPHLATFRFTRGSLSFSPLSSVRPVMITPVDDQKILLISNATAIPHDRERDPKYLLPHCWRLQDCYSCLHSQYHCSWCAISSTCVPNPATWPLLTPIYNPDICSLNDERWELRGNELGCKVSTRTFLSVVVAVLGTVFLICAGWGFVRLWEWSSTRWRGWVRSGRVKSERAMEHFGGWRRWQFWNVVAGWRGNQNAVDERDE